jgi:Tol biopolymer transport system component
MLAPLRKLTLILSAFAAALTALALLIGHGLPRGAQIIYVAGDNANLGAVYLMDVGRGLAQMLLHYAVTGCTWSPDGRFFTFSAFQTSTVDIYLFDLQSLALRNFTLNNHWDGFPSWSPDGTGLVFSSNTDDQAEIYGASADGSGLRRLAGGDLQPGNPTWSPDGERIAFLSYQFSNPALFVMTAAGEQIRPVSSGSLRARMPSWSPDGEWLIFWGVDDGHNSIYRVNSRCNELAEGCGQSAERLFQASSVRAGADPRWSPDGKHVIFTTYTYGSGTIYTYSETIWIMDGDGKARPLTDYNAYNTELAWSSDGQFVAFVSDTERDAESRAMAVNELYLVGLDGAHRRLTFNDSNEWCLAWRP